MFNNIKRTIIGVQTVVKYSKIARPIPSKKPKATGNSIQAFVDTKRLRAVGGKGGDGCISFLQLWSNEQAGPDGGDGGYGGHVIFQVSKDIKDLHLLPTVAKALDGEKGMNKDCNGKNAEHLMIKVPIGTVIRNSEGKVIGDLSRDGLMFIAARGGSGGKGNHFFTTDTQQAPQICEFGADGEDLEYIVEVRSMAHIGLIGFPNSGKSTLLRSISRARPKVAPYPFTTLRPHIGIVEYEDYEQIAVADLPGLIENSHKNKGLGIQFLKHAERCMALLYVVDASLDDPWIYLDILEKELTEFNFNMKDRIQIIAANKIDLPGAKENAKEIQRRRPDWLVLPISAMTGENLGTLLREIKRIYDVHEVR
ncbi:hypothetical protein ABEB36_013292 [Hypothenemus hampei]|uniref:Mitochondrial ribosome-associated GTPase 2 n=1 Tax=Hypothenemus hampei TaxID=57062 RepID=A0ABD1EBX3_HYPHA